MQSYRFLDYYGYWKRREEKAIKDQLNVFYETLEGEQQQSDTAHLLDTPITILHRKLKQLQEQKTTTTTMKLLVELRSIDFELKDAYPKILRPDSPRAAYLLHRKKFICTLLNKKEDEDYIGKPLEYPDDSFHHPIHDMESVDTSIKCMEFIDDGVDIFLSHAGFLSNLISATVSILLLGIFGAGGAFLEAYKAYDELQEECEESKRMSHIIALSTSIAFGLGGGTIGLMSIVGAAQGVSAIGALSLAAAPFVIAAALVSIQFIHVGRMIDKLSDAIAEEKNCQAQYQATEAKKYEKLTAEFNKTCRQYKLAMQKIQTKKERLTFQYDRLKRCSPSNTAELNQLTESIKQQETAENQLNIHFAGSSHDYESNSVIKNGNRYFHAREKRLAAERDLCFSVVSLIGISLVAIGIALASTLLLTAASIATFGALPAVLVVVGAAISIGNKLVEHQNQKNDYRPTNWMREKLIHAYSWFAGDSQQTRKLSLQSSASLFSTKLMPTQTEAPNGSHCHPVNRFHNCTPSLCCKKS